MSRSAEFDDASDDGADDDGDQSAVENEEDTLGEDDQLGFGVVAALAALLVGVLGAYRRR